ncbi:MAG: 16S rRNA (guanine(527)-N(7))-methyltransferase RsmG [Micavibrio aeruginosavorus]|uniref:Ribosomal RNA small subunit methyltransferase G n=1 Tax=Micavibrio aeruginosavorus TaxID=349221 RepID=A0A2W5FRH5_9BACT|nr:MAG: 16S rRNA (guanine(527)-N(7))-methyltransferase RsmG [Micavibrio aeruginosavorus]
MLLELPEINVSRETYEKIDIYKSLLEKWQKTINLVAPSTLPQAQIRHFDDSLQITELIPKDSLIYDIGSGAGFPGLVLAITGIQVHLIESDQRKCQFLKTVSRETNIPVTIHNARVEAVNIPAPDILTARALASLEKLLEWTEKWWTENKKINLIFLKGFQIENEILEAQKEYSFDYSLYQSKTDENGRIIILTDIARIP